MGLFILRRLLLSVPVLVLATLVTFFGVSLVGDPLGELAIQPGVSQATIDRFVERNRLDEPLIVQYWYWLQSVVDLSQPFGEDFSGRPIWPRLRVALAATLQLVVAAEIIAVVVGVGLGVLSAKRQYSLFDYATTTVSFLGYSVPIFWFALILQILVTNQVEATGVRLIYTGGLSSVDADQYGTVMFLVDRVQHLALPIIALAYTSVALYSRYMRSSMLEVAGADYVRTARAKGVREAVVTRKHALRNAMIPIVTLVALNFSTVFSGAIIVEQVFAIFGMGRFFIEALGNREVYPVMAFLLVTAVLIIVGNMIADICYGYLDPRIRRD